MATVTLRNLVKNYGPVNVLKSISATIGDGELVSLLGPSGCGKTTTLRCISGFEIPDSGSILVGDNEITDLPPEKRDIGMVFQSYALFPHMTVFDNVAFGLRMRKVSEGQVRERVHRIMQTVGLKGFDERYPRMLSGGQQQRVAIARALVIEPELLLLDEPLANLDARLREEMRFYLKKLQHDLGITLIYVTHDQAEALVLSNNIIVLFDGVIHQNASPVELYTRPKTLSVANFIGLINPMEVRAASIDDEVAAVDSSAGRMLCGVFEREAVTGQDKLTLVVRPESLTLHENTPKPGDENVLRGVVEEQVYMGSIYDYRIRVTETDLVRVQTPPSCNLPKGTSCVLSFSRDDTILLPGSIRDAHIERAEEEQP